MNNPDSSPDNDKSFSRYIYSDIRDEQKFLQRAMFTVLGLLALSLIRDVVDKRDKVK